MREELEFFGDLKKLWEFCGGVKFMVQKLLSKELVVDLENEGWSGRWSCAGEIGGDGRS